MLAIDVDRTLDARGLLCPMPILKTAMEFKTLGEGEVLKVLSTDRGSLADFPAWAEDTGNEIVGREEEEGILIFYLRKRDEM